MALLTWLQLDQHPADFLSAATKPYPTLVDAAVPAGCVAGITTKLQSNNVRAREHSFA